MFPFFCAFQGTRQSWCRAARYNECPLECGKGRCSNCVHHNCTRYQLLPLPPLPTSNHTIHSWRQQVNALLKSADRSEIVTAHAPPLFCRMQKWHSNESRHRNKSLCTARCSVHGANYHYCSFHAFRRLARVCVSLSLSVFIAFVVARPSIVSCCHSLPYLFRVFPCYHTTNHGPLMVYANE